MMGEKVVEFETAETVERCGYGFRDAIINGRGASARIGGLTARLMGGESLSFYTPDDDSPFLALNNDQPSFSIGVGVPKAQGAHANGTNVHMYVWDRGSVRQVRLWAHHSLTGGTHATKLMQAVESEISTRR